MPRKRSAIARAPVDFLREQLARGVTGCVRAAARDGDRGWAVYLMQGEILAAHGPDDGLSVVRRAVNRHALSRARARELRAAIASDVRWEECLLQAIPDELLIELGAARFRQNALDFISRGERPNFEAMEAVFVDNIQVGHDSRALLDEVQALWAWIEPIDRVSADLTLNAGPQMPGNSAQARLVDVARGGATADAVVLDSPFERGETLSFLREMIEQGVLVSEEGFRIDDLGEVEPAELHTDSVDPTTVGDAGEGAFAVALGDEADDYELDTADFDGFIVGLPGGFGSGVLDGVEEAAPTEEVPPAPDEPEPLPGPAAGAAPLDLDDLETGGVALGMVFASDDDEPSVVDAAEVVAEFAETGPAGSAEIPEEYTGPSPAEETAEPPSVVSVYEDDEDSGVLRPAAPEPPPTGNREYDAAIQRAREEERRRAAIRERVEEVDEGLVVRPPDHDPFAAAADRLDAEQLDVFADHDAVRGAEGQGEFTLDKDFLDVVDLTEEALRTAVSELAADPSHGEVIEMAEAEEASTAAGEKIVHLAFAAPRLDDAAIAMRLDVCNTVLARVAASIERRSGPGAGQACVQLLVDGAPTAFAVLFRGVEVDVNGRFEPEKVFRNLKRRPEAEHRGLLNRGLVDLIERALSYAVEDLPSDDVDALLVEIAGYQKRLGS